ncbi:MAG: hypothetical protein ABI823_13335 [Bryobacteraceae bacterium]
MHAVPQAGLDRMELLERAFARNLMDYADAFRALGHTESQTIPCAGGIAAFAGFDSPLSAIKGAGPEISDRDIEDACAFFRRCGADRVTFEAAPWLSSSSYTRLAEHGFAPADTEAVVVADVTTASKPAPDPRFEVREIDADRWADLMLEAWEFPPTPSWQILARGITVIPQSTTLGVFDSAGRPLGCAAIAPANGIAIFGSDATLASARGQGVQTAAIHDRLRRCSAAGLRIAMAEVAPGSVSERNYLRNGFHEAYARIHYSRLLA